MNCPHWFLYLDLFAAREAEGDHHSSALCDPLGPTPLRFLVLFRSFVIVSPSDCFGLPCSLLSWGFPVMNILWCFLSPSSKVKPIHFYFLDIIVIATSSCPVLAHSNDYYTFPSFSILKILEYMTTISSSWLSSKFSSPQLKAAFWLARRNGGGGSYIKRKGCSMCLLGVKNTVLVSVRVSILFWIFLDCIGYLNGQLQALKAYDAHNLQKCY